MTTKFTGWAAVDPQKPLELYSYEPRPLYDHFVEVKIEHCAICYSDIHTALNDWKGTTYPVIPGHEITGKVVAVGNNTSLKPGDRVGVGPLVQSCFACNYCKERDDQQCEKRVFTYNDTYKDGLDAKFTHGGYADRIRVHEEFAFKIPDRLPLDVAAPLLCAGVTVFTPMLKNKVGPGVKVGVIGIGGLGHLALQFAAKLGAEVTALSHSESKRGDATKLGAHHFVNFSDPAQIQANSLDVIINTSWGKDSTFDLLLTAIKPAGKIIMLAVPEHDLSFNAGGLVVKEVKIFGSLIGSRADMKDMLQFAADNDIKPWIEHYPLSKVNDAIDAVKAGKPRFRVVLNSNE